MPDPRNQFYDAMGGLGGRPGQVVTPPMRLPTDMAGPAPPTGPMPLVQMQGNPPQGTEDGYYGGNPRLPDIDLAQPPQSDPGALEALKASARKPPGTEGMWFVDQVEDGYAVVEDPNGNTTTMRAQPGWKEGMHVPPPKPQKARQGKRRPVP
jgi:hypothetical protein